MKAHYYDIKVTTSVAIRHLAQKGYHASLVNPFALSPEECNILRTLLAIIETIVKLETQP